MECSVVICRTMGEEVGGGSRSRWCNVNLVLLQKIGYQQHVIPPSAHAQIWYNHCKIDQKPLQTLLASLKTMLLLKHSISILSSAVVASHLSPHHTESVHSSRVALLEHRGQATRRIVRDQSFILAAAMNMSTMISFCSNRLRQYGQL